MYPVCTCQWGSVNFLQYYAIKVQILSNFEMSFLHNYKMIASMVTGIGCNHICHRCY